MHNIVAHAKADYAEFVTSSRNDAREHAALDDQLCFALTTATRAVASAYRAQLAPLGLTYPQYLVLLALWERGPQSVSDLGTALHLDSGTLSPLLRRLERSSFVTRRRSTEDERRVLITLTDAGIALETPVADVRASVESSTGLGHEEFVDLRRRLLDLAAALEHASAG